MFRTIAATIPTDNDYPQRMHRLDVLTRVLNGTIYDNLQYSFGEEKNVLDEYIPIRNRRPAVRYNLAKIVVSDSVSLLFSEGHFPSVECSDRPTRETLQSLIKDCGLNAVMLDAALIGSVGSVALWVRVLRNRLHVRALPTLYLTPTFDPAEPDRLLRVREQFKVAGSVLAERGYPIAQADYGSQYWFRRDWDAQSEIWYLPWPVRSTTPIEPQIDTGRTVTHELGVVPMVWVRNLPGGDDVDGACTFEAAIESQIEIDYQLSQAGRGLKYSSDPTLLIKEPAMGGGALIKGGGNAIVVDKDGDARMLEIGGSAAAAVVDYCRTLRELALESVGGNRTDATRGTLPQSGRAMEVLNQPLVWLADKLRIAYGEGALLDLLRLIVEIGGRVRLVTRSGAPVGALNPTAPLSLRWPHWYPSSADDRLKNATTVKTLVDSGVLSRETALNTLAPDYDIEDIPAELARIASDEAARLAALGGGQPQVTERIDV